MKTLLIGLLFIVAMGSTFANVDCPITTETSEAKADFVKKLNKAASPTQTETGTNQK